jgi:hypothetical protein
MSINVDVFNEKLVGRFNTEVLHESEKAQAPERIGKIWEDASWTAKKEGQRLVDVLNFEYIFENTCPESVRKAFESGRMNENSADAHSLQEHVASTIKSSAFDRMFDTCMMQIMQDFSCPEAPFNLRDRITTPINLSCHQEKICEMPMPEIPDLCCMVEDEATPYYGLGDLRCWKTPKACKIKFAFGFNREMLCVDPNGVVRKQIDKMGRWFDEMDELALLKIIFGAEGCGIGGAENCRFPFIYNDVQYDLYQNAAANAPWTNLYADADYAITGCCDSPLVALESLIEMQRDPDTGRPIDCMDNLQVMIPFWSDRWKYLEMIGPKVITSTGCITGTCTQGMEVNRAARDGWSTDLLYSRHAFDVLVDFYTNCHNPVAANAAQAEAWARATYAIGNFRRAIGWGTEWGLETLTREGTDTWEYWDREVVYQRKYMRKATPVILGPWYMVLVRGFDSTPI